MLQDSLQLDEKRLQHLTLSGWQSPQGSLRPLHIQPMNEVFSCSCSIFLAPRLHNLKQEAAKCSRKSTDLESRHLHASQFPHCPSEGHRPFWPSFPHLPSMEMLITFHSVTQAEDPVAGGLIPLPPDVYVSTLERLPEVEIQHSFLCP